MIITRKKKVPVHWLFYAQLPLLLTIYGESVIHAPFLLLMKKFMDNPAAIMGLISMEIYINLFGAPFISWLSDRVWTRWGRRKFFVVIADTGRALCLLAMPFAPNVIVLILLRWGFSLAGSFGSMTQALIYEVVPPPQRGRLSGFFQASVQFGNIIFFFLLLGRFDDYYFMGPFRFITEMSGGAIMFCLCAFVLLGISAFEGLGFREIKPPDGGSINDGRKPGQSIFVHFIKSFYQDVFAKDLLPIYLFVFVTIMFSVNLGIFQPLLYTEQWGYSLQDMGNTMAVGAIFSITFALAAGWFADRFGKIQTFVLASAGSLIMNIFYTVFVAFQPDNRPTLLQIIVIGNITQAFMMVKSVVTYPLMMEYVKRSRMGSASAGTYLFQNLFRSLVLLFVGVWLVWWSVWFFPQAGYQTATTFPDEINEAQLRSKIESTGLDPDDYVLRPIHQYGVDKETSMRWWIHRNDDGTSDNLAELKDLKNELSSLEAEVTSPFLEDVERDAINEKIEAAKARTAAINQELENGKSELHQKLYGVLGDTLFEAGAQLRDARFEDDTLFLSVTTIEKLPAEQVELLEQNLNGPQYQVTASDSEQSSSRWRSEVEVEVISGEIPGLNIQAKFDPNFTSLYRILNTGQSKVPAAFELANSINSIFQSGLGRGNQQFTISSAERSQSNGQQRLSFELNISQNALNSDTSLLAEALTQEQAIEDVSAQQVANNRYRFEIELATNAAAANTSDWLTRSRANEIRDRLASLLPDQPFPQSLATETYLRLADVLASQPFYVSIPENTPRSRHTEREYEYFFSSKTLEIASDLIGFAIIFFIIYIEKKGVIRRYGAEEDLKR
ncbi:MFS transporter [Pelagicoccus sp. SDUM812002]|uniref:MFS transporter n=1 Tax=Pelagicoccus sp. SDUM812002 TaxID=3041266 RepID=UPI00280EA987|nr:MFS transporter [Pelagicoccus sp. SDUM812002]MDQ8184653.1 MFS transporter [Pelagicoccus sp. SDUM812002]